MSPHPFAHLGWLRVSLALATLLTAGLSAAPAQQAKPPAPPAGKEQLQPRWRFVPDQPFYQEVRAEMTRTLKVLEMQIGQTQVETFWSEWRGLRKARDRWILSQKMLGMKLDLEVGGNRITYDSRKKGPQNPLGPGLDGLRGAVFQYPLAPDGKPEEVKGLEAALKAALGKQPAGLQQVVRGFFHEWRFRQDAEATFAFGPPERAKVGKGESWTRKVTLDSGLFSQFEGTARYTYQGKQGKYHKITFETTLKKSEPPVANALPAGAPFKLKQVQLKTGRGSGVILFDPAAGRLVRYDGEFTIEYTMTLDIAGAEAAMEVSQRPKISIKITDTNPLK